MSNEQIDKSDLSDNESSPWKRIAGQEVGVRIAKSVEVDQHVATSTINKFASRSLHFLTQLVAHLYIRSIHQAAKAINRPVIDIGREYSVSALNERINTLEEILVRQWSQLKEGDLLAPNEEIKQYVAACHVARQYDRITPQLLSSRLGVSQAKSEQLIEQLMDDEVITESYSITYHDVRRTMIDATIERKLAGLHRITSTDSSDNAIKKH